MNVSSEWASRLLNPFSRYCGRDSSLCGQPGSPPEAGNARQARSEPGSMAGDFTRGEEGMNSRAMKQVLEKGDVVVGTWVFEFGTPGIARLLASTGIDFVVYDMEHSGFGMDTLRGLIAQTRPLHLAALVRPPANEYHLIAPLLPAATSGTNGRKGEPPSETEKVVNTG